LSNFITETETYEPVRLREDEFESLLATMFGKYAVGWHWFDCKPLLDSEYGRVRPDAILLHETARRWWVVEVELASHPESHFDTQFRQLAAARYGAAVVEAVKAPIPADLLAHALKLAEDLPPELLCVADAATANLTRSCRTHGFRLATMTPARSKNGGYGLAVDTFPDELISSDRRTEYPLVLQDDLWGGRLFAQLPRNFPNKQRVRLRHRGLVHDIRIFAMATSRRALLPPDVDVKARQYPMLVSVDPVNDLFELEMRSTK